jgi:uncharacterized protein
MSAILLQMPSGGQMKKDNNFRKTVLSLVGFSALFVTSTSALAQIIPYDSELIENNYAAEIQAHRVIEERNIRNKETTLLSDDYFERFTGLNYFSPDIRYRIVAKLNRLSKSELTNLDSTAGTPYGFMHFGNVSFFLEGQSIELQVFEFPSDGSKPLAIFVPFRDRTSGKDTFGGGRFMIINVPEGDQIVVDFNMAINPICVYDPEYICPIPPLANTISHRITAGAKMYFDPNDEMGFGRNND